jgi:hypothetical protein
MRQFDGHISFKLAGLWYSSEQHVFASSSTGYLNGWQALDNVAKAAKLEQPDLIRSTLLRKYMATVAQMSWADD